MPAASQLPAGRYGRSLVIASSVSATAKIARRERDVRSRRGRRGIRGRPSARGASGRPQALALEERHPAEHLLAEHGVRLHQALLALVERLAACAGCCRGCRSCRRRGAGSRTRCSGLRAARARPRRRARPRSAGPAANAHACPCPSTRARSRAPRPSRGKPSAPAPAAALDLQQVAEVLGVQEHLLVLVAARCARNGTPKRPPARRSTTDSSSSGLNGLRRNASAPARSALIWVPALRAGQQHDCDDRCVAGSSLSARQSSRPLMPGMLTSRTSTSGRRMAMRSTAPSRALGLVDLEVEDLAGRADESPAGRDRRRRAATSPCTPLHVAALHFGRPAESL